MGRIDVDELMLLACSRPDSGVGNGEHVGVGPLGRTCHLAFALRISLADWQEGQVMRSLLTGTHQQTGRHMPFTLSKNSCCTWTFATLTDLRYWLAALLDRLRRHPG